MHLYSDSATAVAIFQAGRGRDPVIQVNASELWLRCSEHDIKLGISHTPGEELMNTADSATGTQEQCSVRESVGLSRNRDINS